MKKISNVNGTKKNWGKYVAIALALLVSLGITGYFLVEKTSFFSIKTVDVSGNEKLKKDRVLLYSGIAIGDSIMELDEEEIVLNLKSEPYIESVKIEKKYPDRIVLEIVEKKDVLVVDGDKKIYLDGEGTVLSISDSLKSYYVPVVEGLKLKKPVVSSTVEYSNKIEKEEFKDFLAGVGKLGLFSEISIVKITEKNELEIHFGSKKVALLGEFKDIEYKLNYLEEITKDLNKKGKVFEKIDFTRGNRVIVEEKLVKEGD